MRKGNVKTVSCENAYYQYNKVMYDNYAIECFKDKNNDIDYKLNQLKIDLFKSDVECFKDPDFCDDSPKPIWTKVGCEYKYILPNCNKCQ